MAKNKNIFVTITGFQHYYGREPFQIGNLIRCAKEPGNPYDSDAIRAFLPYIGKVGYIANSPQTKAGGHGKRFAHLRARAQAVLRPRAVHHLHQDHLPRRIRRYVRPQR